MNMCVCVRVCVSDTSKAVMNLAVPYSKTSGQKKTEGDPRLLHLSFLFFLPPPPSSRVVHTV